MCDDLPLLVLGLLCGAFGGAVWQYAKVARYRALLLQQYGTRAAIDEAARYLRGVW